MNIRITSKFRPFSFDELLKPMLIYKEAYDKAEEDYNSLAAQTEQWRDIANQTKSPEAYAMFNKYATDLQTATENFSKGMTLQNKGQLLAMKRRYASDIKPIENAANRRRELADEQRRIDAQDPTRLWQRRASDMSLDEFIHNPSADYGKGISGATLTAQVAAGASALAKEYRDNPEKMRELVGGDYYEYVKQRGFSSQAVLAAIMNNPDASPVLTNLVESTMDATGVKDWGSKSTIEQAYNYARQGLWNAVGQDEAQLVNNWRAQENLSNAHAMARQKAAQEFQKSEREATQKFQREQTAPREIVGANGEYTGSYYDPKIGMIVNKNGEIIQGQNGNVSKVGTQSYKNGKDDSDTKLNVAGATPKTLSSATDLDKIKAQGLTPVMAVIPHKGSYQWGKEGNDLGMGDNRRLAISEKTGAPILADANNPSKGYKTIGGKRALFGSTESEAVVPWGDIKYPTKNLEYMPDAAFANLPPDVQASISQAAIDAGVQPGQPYVIYKVPGKSSELFGRDNPKDSYIIFQNNEYK